MALKDITLGQYYPADSVIHRMDPRTKILGTLIFLVSLFVVDTLLGFAFCFAFLAVVVALSTVPVSYMARGLKPVLVLIIFTVLLNMFLSTGEVIWSLGFLKITREGLYRAVFMGVRLILLIFGTTLLTLTTKPITLTDGLERLMKPFSKIGLPAHELAMMMSIALRFIPTLMDETDKIMKAQTARGADFESGNLLQRAKSLIPLLVPLFISAFRIASDLAMAMEARCYHGGEGRTRMNPMKFKASDWIGFAVLAAFLAAVIFVPVF